MTPKKPFTGTRRVRDLAIGEICRHPEHNPDRMKYDPGVYEHICPLCKYKTEFKVFPSLVRGP